MTRHVMEILDTTGHATVGWDPDNEGESGKISQAEANYRRGSPIKHCGVCMHFLKSADGNDGACTRVAGVISPYGISDTYAEAANPFGPTLGPRERAVMDEMGQSGPDQSRYAQMGENTQGLGGLSEPAGAGGFRIGRQRY